MAPRRGATCQICKDTESKYTCSKCNILYCSVSCYKIHKDTSCIERASRPLTIASKSPHSLPLETDGARGQQLRQENSVTSKLLACDPAVPQTSQAAHACGTKAATTETNLQNAPADTKTPNEQTVYPDTSGSIPDGVSLEELGSGSTGSVGINRSISELASRLGPSSPEVGQSLSGSLASPRTSIPDEAPEIPDSPPEAKHRPLRKLTSLKWPYVPDEPSYPDPLTRDDPKSLNLAQYEAIATSASVRLALSSHPHLPALLRELDRLRGPAREEELERVLGVSQSQSSFFSVSGLSSTSDYDSSGDNFSKGRLKLEIDGEDRKALRELAEAVESAVRGERTDVLGLDWEAMTG